MTEDYNWKELFEEDNRKELLIKSFLSTKGIKFGNEAYFHIMDEFPKKTKGEIVNDYIFCWEELRKRELIDFKTAEKLWLNLESFLNHWNEYRFNYEGGIIIINQEFMEWIKDNNVV